jgi:hypothetical protein
MKVGVYHIKSNRPMYSIMCSSFLSGLKKHSVKHDLYTKPTIKKNDLAVVFTNAPRAKSILNTQKENKSKFLTLYIGSFSRSGVVNFRNRNKIFGWDTKTSPTSDALIHCDLLSEDYMTSKYHRGQPKFRLESLNNFGVEIEDWKSSGYILIPEQVHPEGMGHGITDWLIWVKEVCKQIRSMTNRPIKIRRHPNRNAWNDYREIAEEEISIRHKDITFSDGLDCSLSKDLQNAYAVVTISSRCVIEGIIKGARPFTRDFNSLAWHVSNCIGMIDNPILFDRQQWLRDIAYTHWSLDEIASGEYWDYAKTLI